MHLCPTNIELYIDSDSSHCALFGWLGGQGAIVNLTVLGFVKSDNDNTAGIVGYNEGRILECHNRCEVHGRATTGGVAGFSMGIIEKCYKPVEQCANHGSIYSTMRYSDYGKVAGQGATAGCLAEGNLHKIEEWQACCGDYCEFLGETTTEKLEKMGIAEEALITLDTELYGVDAAQNMRQDGFLTDYLFRCLHCKKYHLVADCQ